MAFRSTLAFFFRTYTDIGATTVGTGGDWSPNFKVGDQQCIGPPNFSALVFKKQEISQQVLLLLSETPYSADILVDIQPATVERLRLRSSVVYNLCLYGPR